MYAHLMGMKLWSLVHGYEVATWEFRELSNWMNQTLERRCEMPCAFCSYLKPALPESIWLTIFCNFRLLSSQIAWGLETMSWSSICSSSSIYFEVVYGGRVVDGSRVMSNMDVSIPACCPNSDQILGSFIFSVGRVRAPTCCVNCSRTQLSNINTKVIQKQ